MTSTCLVECRSFLHSSKLNNILQFSYEVFSEGLFNTVKYLILLDGGSGKAKGVDDWEMSKT